MVNQSLTQLDIIINKDYDIIKALNNDYQIATYTPELTLVRGKYAFNIIPKDITPRFISDRRDLENLQLDIFMYYPLDGDEEFSTLWTAMMTRAQAVLLVLYDKQNFPAGISTVDISIGFDNNLIQKERVIDLTFQCGYKIFATR